MTPRPRGVCALIAVAIAALASGCVSIPSSGPVQVGPTVGNAARDLVLRPLPNPPVPGMTPEQIVRGFLQASASSVDDFAIARQYLTDIRAASWDPLSSTTVYGNSALDFSASGSSVAVTGPLEGTIGQSGQWDVAASEAVLEVTFRLDRVDGEWRITGGPDGLLLSRSDVDRGYRTYDLFFFDPSFSTLVPDPVSVPVVGAGLATSLVSRLLRGPTPWLAPAVRTAFPDGTDLVVESVPVDSGIASVDLTPGALGADDSTRRAMSAQLVWTLRQLPDVTGVRITVAGTPFLVSGAATVQTSSSWDVYAPVGVPLDEPARVSLDGRIAQVGDEATRPKPRTAGGPPEAPGPSPTGPVTAPSPAGEPTPGRTATVAPTPRRTGPPATGPPQTGPPQTGSPTPTDGTGDVPDLVAPGVSLDGGTLAALTVDRIALWVLPADGHPRRRLRNGPYSAPRFDRTGTLWTVQRGRGVVTLPGVAGVPAVSSSSPTRIPVVGLPDGYDIADVRDVVPSRDGTRAALLVARASQVDLLVARVERRGGEVRLAAPRRVESREVDAVAVAWSGPATLALLGSEGAGPVSVFTVPLGFGPVVTQSVPEGATTLAAAPARDLLVGTADDGGTVWAPAPGLPRRVAAGIDPAYPG